MKSVSFIFGWMMCCLWLLPVPQALCATEGERDPQLVELMAQMTLEEKVGMVHAAGIEQNSGVPRLGIPPVMMSDGPNGVRWEVGPNWSKLPHPHNSVTFFPNLIALAATWNVDLARRQGEALGSEFVSRGKALALGPALNLMRSPLNGRNFEYMGEDPFLAGEMAAETVAAMQSRGVAVCLKHFACNNQEVNRLYVNVELEERALRELYLPAFEWAVKKGGAWGVMPAYNRIRGEHCAHNRRLLDDILRKEWGFDGVTVSDWAAVHSTDQAAAVSLDIEMGTDISGKRWNRYFLADPYLRGLKTGRYSLSDLDSKVYHILTLLKRLRWLGRAEAPLSSDRGTNLPEHRAAALATARESIVLLQNRGNRLPLPQRNLHLLVVGETAAQVVADSGGSSNVQAMYEISIVEGLRQLCAEMPSVEVDYEAGNQGPFRLVGEKRLAQKAREADAVLLCLGTDHVKNGFGEVEGSDRLSYDLAPSQIRLLSTLLRLRPDTMVTVSAGTPVGFAGMGDRIETLLYSWFNGCENGRALAEVLFGKVNPSGRLPFSLAKCLSDYPAHQKVSRYPGLAGTVHYSEGLALGYRYFDEAAKKPLFPFGFGLSYTSFDLSEAAAKAEGGEIRVQVRVRNSGALPGKTVVQLYVGDSESSLPRPKKELKGFTKIALESGESKPVEFRLNSDAFSFYDPARQGWKAEPGRFSFFLSADGLHFTTVEYELGCIKELKEGWHPLLKSCREP